ncbi:membrane protein [Nocardia cyriacigeorgica]|nr:membrane protein [Nocardia cyriacigeorgica]
MAVSETSQPEGRPVRLRRARIGVLTAAIVVSVLMGLLVLAAWRNDYLISSDMGRTTGEVLSAGRLRSAVMYVTPDGVTHNPKVGVLYPTNLTKGEHINVEYNRADPDLVRVAGRDVRVAIPPALSVIAVTWALALPTLWILRRMARRPVVVASAQV